jgi:anthranilate phosphoribosyltransferase
MEALGVNINLNAAQIADCIRDVGIGFMFAPNHHPAMKNVAPVRKELGVRTIFNILGPLTNPASAPNILMGVFHEDLVGIQVRALQRLGAEHALVVYGRDGLDEISLGAGTLVGELKDGVVREYEVHPEDFGLRMAGTRSLKVENPEESKAMLMGVLQGERPGARYRLSQLRRRPVCRQCGRLDRRGPGACAEGHRQRRGTGQAPGAGGLFAKLGQAAA